MTSTSKTKGMLDEEEYIAAIGASRCAKCSNYHFDDTAICWHCQDDDVFRLYFEWIVHNKTFNDQIVNTIDGDVGL